MTMQPRILLYFKNSKSGFNCFVNLYLWNR